MHWESHCEAFYAQWMIRYLHPRKAPWKEIADLWICEGTQGRGVIVSKSISRTRSTPYQIPPALPPKMPQILHRARDPTKHQDCRPPNLIRTTMAQLEIRNSAT